MQLTINVRDTSGYPTPNVFIGATGTNITINGSTSSGVNTDTVSVTNNTTAEITITKSGYHTYTNTINVFDYDLTLEIFLVEVITDPLTEGYGEPYAYFNSYIKPCSYSVYVVDGSSYNALITNYYQDTVLKSESNKNYIFTLLCPGVFQARLVKLNSLSDNLFHSTYNADITIEEYKPSVTLDIQVSDNGCSGDDCDCIPLDSTITVTPTVILNLNNQPTPACTESTLTYTLKDYEGNTVDTQEFTIINADPIDNSTLVYTYRLIEIGDYTLVTELENCCTSCVVEQTLHACDFIKILESSCHTYTIKNCSDLDSNDCSFTITDMEDNIIEGYENIDLDHASSSVFTSTEDGVYKVIIKNSSDVVIRNYIIIDLCTILSCLSNRILEILCACDCEDKSCTDWCKKDYDLKRIFLLGFDLFNRVNREYRLNSYYTTFDQATINSLTSTNSIIEKLSTYCSSCGNTNINFGNVLNSSNSSSDCGCS